MNVFDVGDATGGNNRDTDCFCESPGLLDVRPRLHSIPVNIGKIYSGNTAFFKSFGQINGLDMGGFGPPFDGNTPVAGINTND